MFHSTKLKFLRNNSSNKRSRNLDKFIKYSVSIISELLEDIDLSSVKDILILGDRDDIITTKFNNEFHSKNLIHNDFNINNKYDLVISYLDIQNIKNISEYIFALSHLIRADGVITGVFVGEESLNKSRNKIWELESRITNNFVLRINPMIKLNDFTSLIYSNNFTNLISFKDEFTLEYNNIYEIISDIRDFGENNLFEENEQVSKELANAIINNNDKIVEDINFISFCASKTTKLLATKVNI